MTYQEALQVLHRTGQFGDILEAQPELNPSMERAILAHTANVPTFLTHFPRGHKPFYMKSDPEDRVGIAQPAPANPSTLGPMLRPSLARVRRGVRGESAGGPTGPPGGQHAEWQSRGESRLVSATAHALAHSLPRYLDLRRFGHAPSGGFGLGLDRFVQSLAGVANIKDVVTFPRWPYHCRL